jgi:hypothetical protein
MPDQPRSSCSPRVNRSPLAIASLAVLAVLTLLTGCAGPTAPSVITVQGRVIDTFSPIANANVLVDGKVTSTATDGTFTVADVHTPYDVTLSFPGNSEVWVYEGLTRTDPTVQVLGVSPGHQATVAGTIGTAPFQPTEVGAMFPGGSALAFGGAGGASGSSTIGPGTVRWSTTDPLHITLYGIRAIVDGSGNPTSYTGYGSTDVTLHDGDALTGVTIPAGSVSTGALSGSLTAPSGYTLNDGRAVIRFGPASAGALVGVPLANATPPGSFSNTMVPIATGIGHGLAAAASDGAGDSTAAWDAVTAPNPSASLILPDVAMPTAPASGATNVAPGTTFSWTALAGSVYLVALQPTGTGTQLYIVTTDTSTTLPDLTAINRALPNGAGYAFSVQAVGPFASMDAAAGPAGMVGPLLELEGMFAGGSGPISIAGPDMPSWSTSSKESTFTTAP